MKAKKEKRGALRETLRIEVSGFNQTRILNALSDGEVVLRDIRRVSPKIMAFSLAKKESAKAFAILEKMCYNYAIIRRDGLSVLYKKCLAHIGLIIGFFVFSILAAISNLFVWRIEINGNEAVDSQLIMRMLGEQGIKTGAYKGKLDSDKIASILRNMDGIVEGSAEIRGTTVFINVLEQKEFVAPQTDNEPRDIYSAYDAEITRINVQRGTSLVKAGDRVFKNATLIKGEIYDTNGELLSTCRPIAQVYGKVTITVRHVFSETETITERTGKTKKFTSLQLLSLRIGKKEMPNWEKVTTTEKLFFIPIRVTQTICYETKTTERKRNIEEYTESLKRAAVTDNIIKAGGSEIETITTLTKNDVGLYTLNIYISAEMLLNL